LMSIPSLHAFVCPTCSKPGQVPNAAIGVGREFEAIGELIEADMEKLAVSKPPVEVHNRPRKSGRPPSEIAAELTG
jgi:hypothetical protein